MELAERLAYACRALALNGHADSVLGHVTARIPGEDKALMKPAGIGLDEVRPEDLITVEISTGKKVAGDRPRHNEVVIHTEIYKARPDVNCVIHTHPELATAFTATRQPLRAVSHEGVVFAEGIDIFEETTDLILTPAQGQAVARHLGDKMGVFLRNHGVVVVGPSIEYATLAGIFLEKAVRMQMYANAFGVKDFSYTEPEEAVQKRKTIYHQYAIPRFWEYYVRQVNRKNPF